MRSVARRFRFRRARGHLVDTMFDDERYVNLATFKRDGTTVETPMWFVTLNGHLCFFTDGTSYKIKRLRRDTRVRVAPCSVRGTLSGEWKDGNGRIVTENSLIQQINECMLAKYGWQLRLLNLGSAVAGRIGRRAYIEVEV